MTVAIAVDAPEEAVEEARPALVIRFRSIRRSQRFFRTARANMHTVIRNAAVLQVAASGFHRLLRIEDTHEHPVHVLLLLVWQR